MVVRALNLNDLIWWPHHRGGWRAAMEYLAQHTHNERGVRFFSAVEDPFFENSNLVIEEPWVGFVHQAPHQTLRFPDLERLIAMPGWQKSMSTCLGLFSLTHYQRRWLKEAGLPVPISVVPYPCETDVRMFDIAGFLASKPRRLVMVGEYLRRHASIFALDTPGYQKTLLGYDELKIDRENLTNFESVEVSGRIDDEAYDYLLTTSLIFLDLIDSTANTSVTECIARNTPVLLNRSNGAVEYLGVDYPLYFDDLDQAAKLAQDEDRIVAAHNYLLQMPKSKLTYETFLERITDSAVYRRAEITSSRLPYDLAILINTYGRIEYFEAQLRALAHQENMPSFQLLVWNNNPEISETVKVITQQFFPDAHIIDSSENVYCLSRLAVVPLLKAPALLIVDDDVLPGPRYVETFYSEWLKHGENTVLCARGHRFKNTPIDEDNPDTVWEKWDKVDFFDEAAEECEVHFAHADNLIISAELMRKLSAFALPWPEVALVDDYWMSYVLSAHLGVSIIKLKAAGIMTLTASSDDPNVALFHNPKVHRQRVNFYIYHTDRGWPAFPIAEQAADRSVPLELETEE